MVQMLLLLLLWNTNSRSRHGKEHRCTNSRLCQHRSSGSSIVNKRRICCRAARMVLSMHHALQDTGISSSSGHEHKFSSNQCCTWPMGLLQVPTAAGSTLWLMSSLLTRQLVWVAGRQVMQ